MLSDEKQMISAARQGQPAAFRELVERHKQHVYYLALDLTRNHHDAEDLSQEVFIRALRALPRFRGESRLSSWLYRITVNCFIDSKRRKQMMTVPISESPEKEALPAAMQLAAETAAADTRLHNSAIQEHIDQALRALSPRERSVFVLRHYHEMPLKDIGLTLDIAEGTVKALLFRAIRRLQKELAFYRPDLGLEEA